MNLRSSTRVFLLVACLASALVACSDRDSGDAGVNSRLMGSRWVLVDVAGAPAIPQVEATLEFPTAGELAGNNSCNHFGGNYKASNTTLRVTGLMQTLIGCEPAIAAQETRYMRVLTAAYGIRFDGEDLLIWGEGFDTPLRFRRNP